MHNHRHERRFDPKQIGRLEDPERQTWLPPEEILSALNLAAGMNVADLGAGTGYFALPIARAVAPGHVYAVDVAPEMLNALRQKLDSPGAPTNISLHQGEAEHNDLADDSCDLVFLATVWHELDDRSAGLRNARRLLRGGGRVAILDWSPDAERPPGPPIEHRIAQAQVEHELANAGFQITRSGPVGRYTYLVIGAKR